MSLDFLLTLINTLGVIAFTISGVIEARRKQMDLIGVCTVAFITAYGGGTIRDVLLGRYPLFWVANQTYVLTTLALAIVAYFVLRLIPVSPKAILIPDALGLGLFSITGTTYALQSHTSSVIAAIMGVITAVFGGVLRDIICNEIPNVFQRTQLYATCALAGALTLIALTHLRVAETIALLAGLLVTFLLRMLAVRFDLKLP
jgi:uncharacterized membrane protein YeiH